MRHLLNSTIKEKLTMKRTTYLALFISLFFAVLAHAQCGSGCIFYGGDIDLNNPNQDGLSNENDATVPTLLAANPHGGATYQNFVAGGLGVKVSGLFTNNLSDLNPTSAYWEICSGVAQNTPGTVVASGFGTANNGTFAQTATGRAAFGYIEYHDAVSGLNLTLSPNTYWFSVVPQDANTFGRSFNSNTTGLYAVGTQINDQQFFDSPVFGAHFDNADNWGVFSTFSSGVYGLQLASDSQAPEPSSLVMLGSGVVGVAGLLRKKLIG
jgi:hypothetical protein